MKTKILLIVLLIALMGVMYLVVSCNKDEPLAEDHYTGDGCCDAEIGQNIYQAYASGYSFLTM